jgi:hypothetical protein
MDIALSCRTRADSRSASCPPWTQPGPAARVRFGVAGYHPARLRSADVMPRVRVAARGAAREADVPQDQASVSREVGGELVLGWNETLARPFRYGQGANKFTSVAHLGDPVGPATAGIASPSQATRFGCSASGGHNAAGRSSEASFSRPAGPKRCAPGIRDRGSRPLSPRWCAVVVGTPAEACHRPATEAPHGLVSGACESHESFTGI